MDSKLYPPQCWFSVKTPCLSFPSGTSGDEHEATIRVVSWREKQLSGRRSDLGAGPGLLSQNLPAPGRLVLGWAAGAADRRSCILGVLGLLGSAPGGASSGLPGLPGIDWFQVRLDSALAKLSLEHSQHFISI